MCWAPNGGEPPRTEGCDARRQAVDSQLDASPEITGKTQTNCNGFVPAHELPNVDVGRAGFQLMYPATLVCVFGVRAVLAKQDLVVARAGVGRDGKVDVVEVHLVSNPRLTARLRRVDPPVVGGAVIDHAHDCVVADQTGPRPEVLLWPGAAAPALAGPAAASGPAPTARVTSERLTAVLNPVLPSRVGACRPE
jgi:hypothetical protein